MWKTTTFLLEREKSRFCELSTGETIGKKKAENVTPAATKEATNFGLTLCNGTPKFPDKFKEIISFKIPPFFELIMY